MIQFLHQQMCAEEFVLPQTLLALWALPRTGHTNYPPKRGLGAGADTVHRGGPMQGQKPPRAPASPHGEGRGTRRASMGIAGEALEVQGKASGDSEEFSGP